MEEDKEKKSVKRSDWDIRPYLAIGALIFLVFCCCIAVFTMIFKYAALKKACAAFVGILQPILIGAVLGYLFNPLMRRIDTGLCGLILPKVKDKEKVKHVIRTVASILTLLIFLTLFGMIIYMIVPALMESIANLVNTMSANVEHFIDWYNNLSLPGKGSGEWEQYLLMAAEYIEEWFDNSLVPQLQDFTQWQNYLTSITLSAINVVVVLKNVVIGLIVSIYVLMEKERFEGQAKKIAFAILPIKQANALIQIVHKVDQIFGGFIIGKIIDSIIIGIICFIGCSILRMPYTLLVSVIIGITNIIPFFGPFIGAIPCLIIVTITDPLHGLYLLIFILVLQQVDGNIIGPKILGESTGLSSFWVIFAIMVGSGLFGFAGMLFGVPTFAVIYYLAQRLISHLLKRKGLPAKSLDYTVVTHVDPETKELCTGDWVRNEQFHFASKKKKNAKGK
ncbi:MAG: AI-2E family transporter [Lachnospiraceae bacterium]|nr:AI-2E family transporter [Lachnospiraceae bacterium]